MRGHVHDDDRLFTLRFFNNRGFFNMLRFRLRLRQAVLGGGADVNRLLRLCCTGCHC
jgi:hypothetical protein